MTYNILLMTHARFMFEGTVDTESMTAQAPFFFFSDIRNHYVIWSAMFNVLFYFILFYFYFYNSMTDTACNPLKYIHVHTGTGFCQSYYTKGIRDSLTVSSIEAGRCIACP